MIVTPAQLLLAIAEHESLEKTCAALPGLTLEGAQKLLRGAAQKLAREKVPAAQQELRAAARRNDVAAGKVVRVFSDGAARGNPGPAGAGAVLVDASGKVLARLGRYLGRQTNNVAEYQGLLLGLQHAQDLGYRAVEVRADSQLLIRQLKGEYAVRHAGPQAAARRGAAPVARVRRGGSEARAARGKCARGRDVQPRHRRRDALKKKLSRADEFWGR